MRNPKLKPWLDAGINRFALHGMNGLNVKEMAIEIDTATSSFYHYFNTKEEYMEQLLEYWHEEGSMKIIQAVFLQDEAKQALRQLFEIIMEENFVYECFLLQLRAASPGNSLFLEQVKQTDKIRVSFMTSLFARTGMQESESRKKAAWVYSYVTGYLACANLVPPNKDEKEVFFEDFEIIFGLNLKP